MSFVDELRSAIFFGRLMGLTPYRIVGKHLQLSPIAVSYSIIVHVVYIYLLYRRDSNVDPTARTLKHTALRFVRIGLVYSGLSIDLVTSLTRHRKFCEFVDSINKFDGRTNFWRDNVATRKREAIVWASVLVPIVILVTMQMYVNFTLHSNWRNWQWGFSLHYIGLGIIVNRYSIMVSCVLRRFQHLNRLFITGQADPVEIWKVGRDRRRLQDAWILHADLVEISEELNSMFNCQSSIWLSAFAFNVIIRVYTLWNTGKSLATWAISINILSTVHSVLLLANLLALCHITAAEANKVAVTVFCSGSKIIQNNVGWVKEDILSIGQYFILRRFNFVSAGGLLRIDLPLLQSIAGVITTYLVILKTLRDN